MLPLLEPTRLIILAAALVEFGQRQQKREVRPDAEAAQILDIFVRPDTLGLRLQQPGLGMPDACVSKGDGEKRKPDGRQAK
jgi:hypothetical protein